VQTLGVWELANRGLTADVCVAGQHPIDSAHCSLCGQCITHCPTGALTARDDTEKVFNALADPSVTTVVQVAPAVRAAWAESSGLSREDATPERMAAGLRALGFDYVFDTDFTADLTIMEEGTEFIHRIIQGDDKTRTLTVNGRKVTLPMFTSCCPGWVRFVRSEFPELFGRLSTAKSPQQMFGAVAKSYFAETKNLDPKKLFMVSIMPCTAKKHECAIEGEGMDSAGAGPDVDVVLTTREFARMLRSAHIIPATLSEEGFDTPLGESTGAGVIFGASGGVMEAALRTVYFSLTGKNPPSADIFRQVRGRADAPFTGVTSAEFVVPIDGKEAPVRVAVTSGLGNARRLIEAILAGEAEYDFVEIMACPGGCAGGGGQPIASRVPGSTAFPGEPVELAQERGARLWALDAAAPVRYSHENKSVQKLYRDYLGEPCGEKAHHLLHVHEGPVV
jgi:NADH-quinone oxidoreductase subunit G